MAVFKWFNGNQGILGYTGFSKDYTIVGDTLTGNETDGTVNLALSDGVFYDPANLPFAIEVDFLGGAKSNGAYTSGRITEIRLLNDASELLMKVTGLDLSLGAMQAYFSRDNHGFWDYVAAGGHQYKGSDDSSGPNNPWTGDNILTGSGNDVVMGGGGDDLLTDMGGADKYYGGTKRLDDNDGDAVSYFQWFWDPDILFENRSVDGILARLDKGRIIGPDGYTDKIFGIENVAGSFLNDRFVGDEKNNTFWGVGGEDSFDGGEGWDQIRFDRDVDYGGYNGVTVNFATGTAVDGYGSTDTFEAIEEARGTVYGDRFVSNQFSTRFVGLGGDDTFQFSKNAKKNADWADGGSGADTFVIKGSGFRRVEIQGFNTEEDILKIKDLSRRRDADFSDDDGNLVITFKDNEVVLFGVSTDDFGFSDLG